jgi:hypothetical protein
VFLADGFETRYQMLHVCHIGSDNIQQPKGDGEKQDICYCTAVHTGNSYVCLSAIYICYLGFVDVELGLTLEALDD